MGYFKATARGISWVGGFRIFTRLVAFGRTILLARILLPAQFGVYAIATLILAFLEILTETGINVFLIQKKGKIDDYIDTAWIVSIARGFVIGALIFATSGWVANFFNSPDATALLMIVSLVPIARGFINPSIAKYQKDLMFGKDFFIRSFVFIFDSVVSVIATIYLHSPIGIIWGLLSGAVLEVFLSWLFIIPTPKFRFNNKKFWEIVTQGKWVTFAGIFNYINGHIDDTVVGKMLGTGSLGIYQMAYKLSTLPLTEVTQVFNKVTFPVYVKIRNDNARLWRAFSKTFLAISILSIPIGVLLYLSADYLVPLLLGESWQAAAPALKVLSIFGVLKAITGSTFSLYLAQEKQSYVASLLLCELIVLSLLLLPFINIFGHLGAAYATIVAVVLPTPLNIFYLTLSFKKSKV